MVSLMKLIHQVAMVGVLSSYFSLAVSLAPAQTTLIDGADLSYHSTGSGFADSPWTLDRD